MRSERRPGSKYASLAQCAYELRQAEQLYRRNNIPHLNSANMSIEEIAAMVMQEKSLQALASQGCPSELPSTGHADVTTTRNNHVRHAMNRNSTGRRDAMGQQRSRRTRRNATGLIAAIS